MGFFGLYSPASPRFTVPSAPWAAASGSRGVLVQPRGASEVGVDPGGEKLTRRRVKMYLLSQTECEVMWMKTWG